MSCFERLTASNRPLRLTGGARSGVPETRGGKECGVRA